MRNSEKCKTVQLLWAINLFDKTKNVLRQTLTVSCRARTNSCRFLFMSGSEHKHWWCLYPKSVVIIRGLINQATCATATRKCFHISDMHMSRVNLEKKIMLHGHQALPNQELSVQCLKMKFGAGYNGKTAFCIEQVCRQQTDFNLQLLFCNLTVV